MSPSSQEKCAVSEPLIANRMSRYLVFNYDASALV